MTISSRRKFIVNSGLVISTGLLGVVGWRFISQSALSNGMGIAYKPWKEWKPSELERLSKNYAKYKPEDSLLNQDVPVESKVLAVIRAGILAPSPLNSQPWAFKVDGLAIHLYIDPTRVIHELDPLSYELYLSIGCLIENMVIAASAIGFSSDVVLESKASADGYVGLVNLSTVNQVEPLFYEAIPLCNANRGLYKASGLEKIGEPSNPISIGGNEIDNTVIFTKSERQEVIAKTIRATEKLVNDSAVMDELYYWYRHDRTIIHTRPEGYTIDSFGLPKLKLFLYKIAPKMSKAQLQEFYVEHQHYVLRNSDDTYAMLEVKLPIDMGKCIEAGRKFQQIQLWAASMGLSIETLNHLRIASERESRASDDSGFKKMLATLSSRDENYPLVVWRMGISERKGSLLPRRALHSFLKSV